MSIAVDAVSDAQTNYDLVTLTWSHTCLGSERLLVVSIAYYKSPAPTVTGVTYNEVALTQAGTVSGVVPKLDIWYLIAPATGSHSIVITFSATVIALVGAVSWNGVSQSAPVGSFSSATGNDAVPTLNVASAVGEFVTDVVSSSYTETVGPGQTQRFNALEGGLYGAGSTQPGATTVTMSWTQGFGGDWVLAALPIKPALAVEASHVARYEAVGQPFASLTARYEADGLPITQSFQANIEAVQQPDSYYTIPISGAGRVRQS